MRWILIFLFLLINSSIVFGWDGYDHDNNSYVEIEKGNLVRAGNEIEFYDYEAGYRAATVENIERNGNEVEIQVLDHESQQYRTLTMKEGAMKHLGMLILGMVFLGSTTASADVNRGALGALLESIERRRNATRVSSYCLNDCLTKGYDLDGCLTYCQSGGYSSRLLPVQRPTITCEERFGRIVCQ